MAIFGDSLYHKSGGLLMLVTFCGHRHVSNRAEVDVRLRQCIAALIADGATEFYCGGYGEFDSMAAAAVRDAKKEHPDIKCTLVIPYLNRDYNTSLYDGSVYPPSRTLSQSSPSPSAMSGWLNRRTWLYLVLITTGAVPPPP